MHSEHNSKHLHQQNKLWFQVCNMLDHRTCQIHSQFETMSITCLQCGQERTEEGVLVNNPFQTI